MAWQLDNKATPERQIGADVHNHMLMHKHRGTGDAHATSRAFTIDNSTTSNTPIELNSFAHRRVLEVHFVFISINFISTENVMEANQLYVVTTNYSANVSEGKKLKLHT